LVACGLTTPRQAHEHDTKADIECLEEFDDLLDEVWYALETKVGEGLLYLRLQISIIGVRYHNAGEEVTDECTEEREIVTQEFGYVGVPHRTDEDDFFVEIGFGTLQLTCHHQHRLHGSHTEIVVVLLAELLGGEFV
jgi:hypothetical protein